VVYFFYMAPKEVTLAELGAMLTHVVDHMATKEDIAEVKDDIAEMKDDIANVKDDIAHIGATMATKNDLAQVFSDIKAIRNDLDDLRDAVGNLTGFRKEIDHAFDRIAAIERHLGVEHKATPDEWVSFTTIIGSDPQSGAGGSLFPRQANENSRIMATCTEQDETVPDRGVIAQALPDVKERAERVENAPNRQKQDT
jgi:hypothetical protein